MSVTRRRKIAERSTKCHVSCTSRIGTCCVDRARSAGGGVDVKTGRGETNAGANVINASGVDSWAAAAVAAAAAAASPAAAASSPAAVASPADVMVLAGGLRRYCFDGVGSPQEVAGVTNANGVGSPQEVADVINANGVGSPQEVADVINANGVGSPQEVADVINANGVGSLADRALECRAYTGDEYHRLANSAR